VKVVILGPWAPQPDGLASHSGRLATAMIAQGHDVLAISTAQRGEATEEATCEGRLRAARVLGYLTTGRARRHLKAFDPDVVIVQFAISAAAMHLISTLSMIRWLGRSDRRLVITSHEAAREGNRLGALSRLIYRFALTRGRVVVFSPNAKEAVLELCPRLVEADVALVPHGCEVAQDINPDDRSRVADRYDVRSDSVLALGFTHPDKGTDIIVRSIVEKQTRLASHLVVAGAVRKRTGLFRLMGRADEAFAERVNQLSHLDPDHVRFCGYVPDDDVQALLATAGVVALPYTNTTQSGVAAMALTAGACVVASDLPGLRFGLGDAALFVPVGDPRALGAAIDEVLGNPTLSEQLRERAKALSAKDSYDKVAESILDLGA